LQYCLLDQQVRYVTRQIRGFDQLRRENEARVREFTTDYLKQDGVFVMRLVGKNVGEVIAAEILFGLWTVYAKRNALLLDDGLTPFDV